VKTTLKILLIFFLLYLFLLSIGMMGTSFKLLGKEHSLEILKSATANPFIGLLVGILATSLVQSSSTITSMIVAIVASGTLDVGSAVPIIMGANIGTTITNTLVSLSHITQKHEFRRAYSSATVHDFFNLMAVAILLPIEIFTHVIEKMATALSSSISSMGGVKFTSPVKTVTQPAIHWIQQQIGIFSDSDNTIAWMLLVISLFLLFGCLILLTKTLKSLMLNKLELFFDKLIGQSALMGMALGVGMTVLVQSSSITTSLLVPMAGAGIITLRQVFPVTLGANIGTTITALLATLAISKEHSEAALTIALCHLIFNVIGILIIYPWQPIRNIPLRAAEKLADIAVKSKRTVVFYIVGVFFGIPGFFVFLTMKVF